MQTTHKMKSVKSLLFLHFLLLAIVEVLEVEMIFNENDINIMKYCIN